MKRRLIFLFITTIILTLVILSSCNEPNIVENKKIEKQEKPLLKKRTTKESNFETTVATTDTIITLPKSKKMIAIQKGISKKHIKQLDKYFSESHEILSSPAILPNKLDCGIYIEYIWEFQSQYKSIPGKYLGIWSNKVDWTKLHDQYGFTNIIVNFSKVQNAINAHFQTR